MKIIITDSGLIWNERNPYLKKYKDVVLVVCLNGKKVTDEYECFISPYKMSMNADKYGVADQRLTALASVAQ